MIAMKTVKWIVTWKKNLIHFDASQLKVFLLSANFKSDGMMLHRHALSAKYSFKMAASEKDSFWKNFFRITDTSEAETLMNVYLLQVKTKKESYSIWSDPLKKIRWLLMPSFIFYWLERKF